MKTHVLNAARRNGATTLPSWRVAVVVARC